MEGGFIFIGILVFAVLLYRRVLPIFLGPKAIVRALLRRYHLFERTGLPEPESLYRVLASRSGWRNLPTAFLAELIARLKSKENVFRFVSLAEGYQYNRKQLRVVATKQPDVAMKEVAAWLHDFGERLQKENQLKEAEFVQKLALELLPDQFSAMLPLAATYYKMERYGDAAPLFKKGLAQMKASGDGAGTGNSGDSISTYEEMYEGCLQAAKNQREAL